MSSQPANTNLSPSACPTHWLALLRVTTYNVFDREKPPPGWIRITHPGGQPYFWHEKHVRGTSVVTACD